MPAVYPYRYYVDEGGLISYGPDLPGLLRQAAGYVDRPQGREAGQPPCAGADKARLVVNLKAAKAIGLRCHSRCSPVPTR
jgi:putative ABC transport system substrate-binding protein